MNTCKKNVLYADNRVSSSLKDEGGPSFVATRVSPHGTMLSEIRQAQKDKSSVLQSGRLKASQTHRSRGWDGGHLEVSKKELQRGQWTISFSERESKFKSSAANSGDK